MHELSDLSRHRWSRLLWAAVLFAFLALPAVAQETSDDDSEEQEPPRILTFGFGLIGEWDDNVNLGADVLIVNPDTGVVNDTEIAQDDIVLRAKPEFGLDLEWGDESYFTLDLAADFREGTDTDLSEYNANGGAILDLSFENGFGFNLFDRYVKTNFDQALFLSAAATTEAGISESEMNAWGGGVRYRPVERLEIGADYEKRDEDYVYDDRTGAGDQRDVERIEGRVFVPVAKRLRAYARYASLDQESATRLDRTYEDERWLAGLEFEGPNESKIFVEAGESQIDFADSPEVDFDGVTIYRAGVDMNLAEDTLLRASLGRDGYENTVWELIFDRTVEASNSFQVIAQKTTQPSFSGATLGRFFEATLAAIRASRFLAKSLELAGEVSYFKLVSTLAGDKQIDETYLGRVQLFYAPREWVRFGPHYQYSERTSTFVENRFVDNRAGLSLLLVY